MESAYRISSTSGGDVVQRGVIESGVFGGGEAGAVSYEHRSPGSLFGAPF
jgi:hypothetical protein